MKDPRTKTVKILIEGGHVADFAQIFTHIPKTAAATQLGINFTRMQAIIKNVNTMRVSDIYLFSGYFEVDVVVIFQLINNQHSRKKR